MSRGNHISPKGALSKKKGLRAELQELIDELSDAEAESHWGSAQKEQPGITRDKYKVQLVEDVAAIKNRFYSENGFLKPRLVRNRKDKK